MIGEGIQGNPYKLKGQTIKFYNIFDIDQCIYYGLHMFHDTMENILGLESVPLIYLNWTLPDSVIELLKLAEGKSTLNKNTEREGLVIRSMDRRISFKVISNKYLINEK